MTDEEYEAMLRDFDARRQAAQAGRARVDEAINVIIDVLVEPTVDRASARRGFGAAVYELATAINANEHRLPGPPLPSVADRQRIDAALGFGEVHAP